MRGRKVRVAAICALLVVGALVGFLSTRSVQQGATEVDSPLLGTRAPDVVATTLAGGHVSLASLRGSVVVLSFFASWCPPCHAEAPALARFDWLEHVRHARTTMLGVVFDDEDVAAASFVHTYGLTFPVLEDPNGTIENDFAVTAPPVTIVLTPSLRVDAVLEGEVTASQLVALARGAQGAS